MKYLLIVISVLFSLSVNAQRSVVHDNITARVKVTVGDSATSTGNVGISTKNPTQKLDVNGGVRVRNLTEGIVVSDADGVLSTDTNVTLKLVVTDSLRIRQLVNDSTAHILGATDSGGVVKCVATCDTIQYILDNLGGGGYSPWDTLSGDVFLKTITDNVGIGTNTPQYKLETIGNAAIYEINGDTISGFASDILNTGLVEIFGQLNVGATEGRVQADVKQARLFSNGAGGQSSVTAVNDSIINVANHFQIDIPSAADGYVLTSDAGGNATWQDPNAAPAARQSNSTTPTDGGSDTIPDNTEIFIMSPASLLATYTLVLPANPVTNQLLRIVSSGFGITALTLNVNAGQSIVGGLTTLAANVNALYFFDGTVWIKL